MHQTPIALTRRRMLKAGLGAFALSMMPSIAGSVAAAEPRQRSTTWSQHAISNWISVNPKNSLARTSGLFGRRAATDTKIAADIGFGYVRWDLLWEVAEWQKGVIDTSWYDKELDNIRKNNLRAMFILDFGHKWYDGSRIVRTDAGIAGYKRHVDTMVRRFGDMADFWEIWNEPNLLWDGPADPLAYARIVREAAPLIKSIRPDSAVIAGATSQIDLTYLGAVLAAGIGGGVDILSLHPYLATAPETVLDRMAAIRQLAGRWPVTFSEWGYSTYNNPNPVNAPVPVSRDQQGSYAVRLMLTGHVLEHPITVWYDASDDGSDSRNFEHNLGLVDAALNPKPAYYALKQLFKTLGQRRADAYSVSDGVFTVRFPGIGSDKPAYVVWNNRDNAVSVSVDGASSYTPLIGSSSVGAQSASLAPNDVALIETDPTAGRSQPYRVNVASAAK